MTSSRFISRLCTKKLFLPPISGYTDFPYRTILSRFKPPFLITEMANARAVVDGNKKTTEILRKVDGKQFNGVQLFGSDPLMMSKAGIIIEELGFDYIDINMGCTVRKVTSRGAGVSLMADEAKACAIVSALSNAVDIPITCKLRLGVSRQKINVLAFSKKIADAGAVAVTIHGRTGEKKFGTPLDFNIIKQVTSTLPIPVIANGGIYTGIDAYNAIEQTGAAAVMPGRGLIGNPWLVPEILHTFSKTKFIPPTIQEKKDVCVEHLDLLNEFYGERNGVLKMRSILPHYFSSCRFLKRLKTDVHEAKNTSEIHRLLENIKEMNGCLIYQKKR